MNYRKNLKINGIKSKMKRFRTKGGKKEPRDGGYEELNIYKGNIHLC